LFNYQCLKFEKNIVKQYESKYFDQWNAFMVKPNATFLFHRTFMEYHEIDLKIGTGFENFENLLRYCLQTELKLLFFHIKATYGGLVIMKN
jgi:hypothetical protein